MSPTNRIKFRDGNVSSLVKAVAGRRFGSLLVVAGFVCLLLTGQSRTAQAYTFSSNPPTVWPDGFILMYLLDSTLGPPGGTMIDGNTSWRTVAENALAGWNLHFNAVQFTVYTQSPKPRGDGDRVNQVFFAPTFYGQSFGSGVLAVTTGWKLGTTRTEADVVFNDAMSWNSYRGNLQPAELGGTLNDFYRVALHEFGHVLGLGHPDQAGQSVYALMNSRISDLDELTVDDTNGAAVLYARVPPTAPTATAATSVTTSGFSANWGSASGATGYRLDVSIGSTFTSYVSGYQSLDLGNLTTQSVNGLSANTTYYYRVRAYNSSGTSGNSSTIAATTPPNPPSAPP